MCPNDDPVAGQLESEGDVRPAEARVPADSNIVSRPAGSDKVDDRARIVVCPNCGARNRLPAYRRPDRVYRCAKCGTMLRVRHIAGSPFPTKWDSIRGRSKRDRIVAAFVLGAMVLAAVLLATMTSSIPYAKLSGERVNLVNNPDAQDPSWSELESFLKEDPSDLHFYITPSYTCGDFAEQLHNNAELAGIKAAFCVVEFYEGPAHALNAFQTRDKGLVYIDVTGKEFFGSVSLPSGREWGTERLDGPDSSDKVAYIEVGKALGFVSIESVNGNLDYSYLAEGEGRMMAFFWKLVSFSLFVDEHNRCPHSDTPCLEGEDYERAKTWETELQREWQTVRGFAWEPLGVVKSVETYW